MDLPTIEDIRAAETVDGYRLRPESIRAVNVRDGVVSRFVAQSTMRGRPWLCFVRRFTPVYPHTWWVTAHKTRREAIGG